MRIEGYVPVDAKNGGTIYWDWSAKLEVDVAQNGGYSCIALMKEDGWEIIRVGDVDTIREEVLEEAANNFFQQAADPRTDSRWVDVCRHVGNRIRAMKAKP